MFKEQDRKRVGVHSSCPLISLIESDGKLNSADQINIKITFIILGITGSVAASSSGSKGAHTHRASSEIHSTATHEERLQTHTNEDHAATERFKVTTEMQNKHTTVCYHTTTICAAARQAGTQCRLQGRGLHLSDLIGTSLDTTGSPTVLSHRKERPLPFSSS